MVGLGQSSSWTPGFPSKILLCLIGNTITRSQYLNSGNCPSFEEFRDNILKMDSIICNGQECTSRAYHVLPTVPGRQLACVRMLQRRYLGVQRKSFKDCLVARQPWQTRCTGLSYPRVGFTAESVQSIIFRDIRGRQGARGEGWNQTQFAC